MESGDSDSSEDDAVSTVSSQALWSASWPCGAIAAAVVCFRAFPSSSTNIVRLLPVLGVWIR